MDNRETLVTSGTQDTGRRQIKKNTIQKTKKTSNMDTTKKPRVNPGARNR
jgi:hypothetical protein